MNYFTIPKKLYSYYHKTVIQYVQISAAIQDINISVVTHMTTRFSTNITLLEIHNKFDITIF